MITLIGAALLAASTVAQAMQDHAMPHADMAKVAPQAPAELHETGQAEFAAIAEATRALEAAPDTDWSKADIDALRAHLVDMDNVTVRSRVVTAAVPNGARFSVTSADAQVRESIGRMVRLHSGMANREGPYRLEVRDIAQGVALTVTGRSTADAAKIRGLGFFGLLTEGVHHQQHHLMLARGEGMNH
jgi:hypothetical protein